MTRRFQRREPEPKTKRPSERDGRTFLQNLGVSVLLFPGSVVLEKNNPPPCHLERSMPTSNASRHAQSKDPYPASTLVSRRREFSRECRSQRASPPQAEQRR